MAYQKTGYQDSLEFDPSSGIIKYGNYEFFADQAGVKPTSFNVTLDDYIKTTNPIAKLYPNAAAPVLTAKQRESAQAQMIKDLQSGVFAQAKAPTNVNASIAALQGNQSPYSYNPGGSAGSMQAALDNIGNAPAKGTSRNVTLDKNGNATVTSYAIPQDIDFVDSLNKRATQISQSTAAGQVSDANRPEGKTNRLNKANLSRAATVLTAGALAGAPSNLGGAPAALGV